MSTVQTNISKQSVQESLKELATVVDGVCEALYKLAAIDPYFARKEVQRQAGKWGADLDAIWHNLKAADFDPNEWLEGRKNAMSAPVTAAKPATVPASATAGKPDAAGKTLTLAEFQKLDVAAQNAHIRSGGKLTD